MVNYLGMINLRENFESVVFELKMDYQFELWVMV